MESGRLRQFFHASRQWARAKTGMELFHYAGELLAATASIDSGFFVYRKRLFNPGVTPARPEAHAAWGKFRQASTLNALVTEGIENPQVFDSAFERWTTLSEFPPMLQDAWNSYQFHRVGLWPLLSRERTVGIIVGAQSAAASPAADELASVILDACSAQLSVALDLTLAIRRAEDTSQRDWLTGLWNRRGVHDRLAAVLDQAERQGRTVIIGVLDLDHLKMLNDTHGHPAGDDALRRVAEILMHAVRADDVVARWGGDEFVVVVSGNDADADGVMERLRSAVTRQAPDLSISVGGAVWGVDGVTWDQCYDVADQRLYRSKHRRV